jgi:hypothetical protein
MKLLNRLFLFTCLLFLSACQTLPTDPPKQSVTFIDTSKFDTELASSLSGIKQPIDVDFYSPVNPNQIPPRLEKWIALAEKNGGKIIISQPVGEPTPKDPFILLGLFTGMWQAIKIFRGEAASYSMDESVKNRNVNIALARNSQGNLYVQKIVFEPKEPK